jgi:2-dehydro-3-deoxyglucarate aldolase/4-hydroxy-2-oxoheptanedioate aldolase
MRTNAVKAAFREGRIPLGTMVVEFDTTGIGPLARAAGAEWILFDQEHSGWTTDRIRQLIVSARAAGLMPIVRPPALQYHLNSQLLDLGAMGLLVPMLESVEQARQFVSFSRYPPVGRGGATAIAPHDDYLPGDPAEKMRNANDEIMTIALIETPLGVSNVEEIAAVEGLDSLWVGHFDLSSMMGKPAQFDTPEFLAAITRVTGAAASAGKPVGIVVRSSAEARLRLSQSFTLLLYSNDTALYLQALKKGLEGLQEVLAERSEKGL